MHPRDNPRGVARFVGLEHIESGTGRRTGSVSVDLSDLTGRKPVFRKGDLVYGYLRPYLNKVWVAEFDGLCSVDQYVYEVDQSTADTEFVAWFMRSPVYLETAPIDTTPGQLPRIRTEEVAEVPIALPPLAEQRAFAAELAKQMAAVERAREALRDQLDAARRLDGAVYRTIFSGKPASGWPMRLLGDVARVSGGIQKTPERVPRAFHRPYLTVRNVLRGSLDLTSVEESEVTPAELEHYRLEPGDLLIVEGNGSRDQIGRNAIFRGEIADCVHQNHVIRVRLSSSLADPQFVGSYLNSPAGRVQLMEKAITTTGLHTLSTPKVEALEIPLPNLRDQRAVVSDLQRRLVASEQLSAGLVAQLRIVEQLPGALLRQAFAE